MKKIVILLALLVISSVCYAENRVFYDNSTGKEVCDLNGIKTVEEINKEFNGNFTDITEQRKVEATARAEELSKQPKRKTLEDRVVELESKVVLLESAMPNGVLESK